MSPILLLVLGGACAKGGEGAGGGGGGSGGAVQTGGSGGRPSASGGASGAAGSGGASTQPTAGGASGAGGAGGTPAPATDASTVPDATSADADEPDAAGGGSDGGGDAAGPLPAPALGVRFSMDPPILARWPGPRRSVTMEGDRRIFTHGFEAGKFGGGGNGVITRIPITPGSEYVLEYRLRFDPGFDFSRGGKIAGLQGASAPSGCKRSDSLGFSARQMWREGGRVIGYIYDMDQTGACGNAITTNFSFSVGRWYAVKVRVKLNTARNHDGVLQVSFDDNMVINRSNMAWMVEGPERRIDDLMLDFFFGGSTADWAPSRNCSLSFSDMFLTRLAD